MLSFFPSMKLIFLLVFVQLASAQSTNSNRLPPPGIPVPADVRNQLQSQLLGLQSELKAVAAKPLDDHQLEVLPDVEIFEKAVRYALQHNEFFRTNEFAIASKLIDHGRTRAVALGQHQFPWLSATGLVVRAYQSKIDRSVQPYGLVIPTDYKPGNGKRYRLDVWLHGRDETLTELKFINERLSRAGEFISSEAIVLHAYGRYCNAFKFAGETDVFEAIDSFTQTSTYPLNGRVTIRGFSMGGAGVWHLATHYADRFVVAAPGAGFAESAQYLRLNLDSIPTYQRKLFGWYDATDYAANLFNLPVIAYSGELDKQRQAADVMAAAMFREGLSLVHLIGPKTEHKYEPETKKLLSAMVDTIASIPRPTLPPEVRLTTRTLRYPKMHWLLLTGLEKHWERADALARLDFSRVILSLTNVTSFALDFQSHSQKHLRHLEINGQKLELPRNPPELIFITKTNNAWALASTWPANSKTPGLQGPIDDAFLDSFIFVTPSKPGFHPAPSDWIDRELQRARFEWRAQFRGDAILIQDSQLTEDEIKRSNLILWGDPQSNSILRRILPHLPLKWTSQQIQFGTNNLPADTSVPLLIFPNPLNPEKYVVLNSGFTFRGFGSNASQTPKLPDYAMLNISEKDPFQTGIISAGFFNERWQIE
jgi:hypothetical protein